MSNKLIGTTLQLGLRNEIDHLLPDVEFDALAEVDGAFAYSSNNAACGGIIKDRKDTILEGFQMGLEAGDALTIELWACLMGLKRLWDLGHRSVLLRSDSQEALRLIQGDPPELHEDVNLIKEVQAMIRRAWRVELRYIARDDNLIADALAKNSLQGGIGLQLLHPDTVIRLMHMDTGD
ncbi:uncharacterized protein LOC114730743 [Neltuma alba]|uniref:uncharacterized protein LOC114730743 n=1 Tax=Neltuma alba TaxID=207710 RepID=UPI0010A4F30A|nr:uncharacterized protein LOC114730743 [Prosopis alba]